MIKLNIKKTRRYCQNRAERISWAVSIALLLAVLFFWYNNFLTTISDIRVLIQLKSQVAIEAVDIKAWQRINQKIEWKKAPLDKNEAINNPFG